jgi:hypothetical protein
VAAKQQQAFKSAKELRQILDQVLRELETDEESSSRMSAAAAPLQLEFTDLKLVLNIAAIEPDGTLSWNFKRKTKTKVKPKLRLAMSSDVANRMFQGRENPAIAIARGRLRPKVEDAAAALRFFPAAKPMFAHYTELVAEKYPHLTID